MICDLFIVLEFFSHRHKFDLRIESTNHNTNNSQLNKQQLNMSLQASDSTMAQVLALRSLLASANAQVEELTAALSSAPVRFQPQHLPLRVPVDLAKHYDKTTSKEHGWGNEFMAAMYRDKDLQNDWRRDFITEMGAESAFFDFVNKRSDTAGVELFGFEEDSDSEDE